jgi:hypothetical protein
LALTTAFIVVCTTANQGQSATRGKAFAARAHAHLGGKLNAGASFAKRPQPFAFPVDERFLTLLKWLSEEMKKWPDMNS